MGLSKSGRKELAMDIEKPTKGLFMIGVWPDGMKKEITQMTVAEYLQSEQAAESVSKARKDLWSGIHIASGLPVTVNARPDREPLMSLYWSKNQICQAVVGRFSKEADVVASMAMIGENFCNGT